jgi:hypothetical protein
MTLSPEPTMDRTVTELRNRIANLEVQRDALASIVCDLKQEADIWRYRFAQSEKIANMLERERDAAIRRVEADRCCGRYSFDVTI